MVTDWMAILKEAGVLVQKTEADTLRVLQNNQLDIEQALRLLEAVSELSDEFDEVFAELYADESADEELLAAAETIGDLWSELCMLCAEKVGTLRQA